jgi:hypothetical protein
VYACHDNGVMALNRIEYVCHPAEVTNYSLIPHSHRPQGWWAGGAVRGLPWPTAYRHDLRVCLWIVMECVRARYILYRRPGLLRRIPCRDSTPADSASLRARPACLTRICGIKVAILCVDAAYDARGLVRARRDLSPVALNSRRSHSLMRLQ